MEMSNIIILHCFHGSVGFKMDENGQSNVKVNVKNPLNCADNLVENI